ERRVQVAPGPYALLAVTDTGMGMDAETLEHVFEPFYTTKQGGTGLGLSTAYGIVKQSSGYIWAYSEPGHGTTFKVYLPIVAEDGASAAGRGERHTPAEPATGTETILLVEDDDLLLELAATILREAGYEVLSASGGDAAAKLARERKEPVHLIVSDVVMSGLMGRALLDALTAHHPEARVLWISGYMDERIRREELLEHGEAFLPKPFDPDTLTRKIREVLDGRE
ncbi:MAG: response regulator, partial [Dehalococcoidia bacterium]|nr:response regulator [Dehalococcoidia bacterium]